mgnify:CR=1 FL=1
MPVVVTVKDAQRAFALRALTDRLAKGPLTVERDSHVASVLNIDVTSRVMASAINLALRNHLIARSREEGRRGFYDPDPVTYTITPRGREYCAATNA